MALQWRLCKKTTRNRFRVYLRVVVHFLNGPAKNLRGFIIVWSRTRWLNLLARKRRLWSSLLRAIDRALAKNTRRVSCMVGYLLHLLFCSSTDPIPESFSAWVREAVQGQRKSQQSPGYWGWWCMLKSYNCLLFFVFEAAKCFPSFSWLFRLWCVLMKPKSWKLMTICQQSIQVDFLCCSILWCEATYQEDKRSELWD